MELKRQRYRRSLIITDWAAWRRSDRYTFRNQPVGCTATIIYQMYQESGVEVKPQMAGLLCSAINFGYVTVPFTNLYDG